MLPFFFLLIRINRILTALKTDETVMKRVRLQGRCPDNDFAGLPGIN